MKSNFSSKPFFVPTAAKSVLLVCKLDRLIKLSWALILNLTAGYFFWNSEIKLGIMCSSGILLPVMVIVPESVCLVVEILAFVSFASWSIFSAASFRAAPASVTSTPLAVRLKSSASKYFSSAAMWWLTVPWLVFSSLAATEKLHVLATVRNVFK